MNTQSLLVAIEELRFPTILWNADFKNSLLKKIQQVESFWISLMKRCLNTYTESKYSPKDDSLAHF